MYGHRNLKPEISSLSEDRKSLPENATNIIFATCILHNYLRDQGLGLSDMGVLQMFETILQKYQTKEEVPTNVLMK